VELSIWGTSSIDALGDGLASSTLRLRRLILGDVAGSGVAEVIAARHANLRELALLGCDVGDDGARAAAALPLRSLTLARCGIHDDGALAIASSPALERLVLLDLRNNKIGDRATAALRERFGGRLFL
jgi:hypothetical protein